MGLTRRGGWGLLAQAANSLGNVLLAVVVARAVDAPAFGAWSLGFVGYVLVVAACRQVLATPLLLRRGAGTAASSGGRHARPAPGPASDHDSGYVAASLGLAVAGSVLLLGVSVTVSGALQTAALLFAALLPGVILHDAMRYVAFAHGDSRGAARGDLAWLGLQCAGFVGIFVLAPTGMIWPSVVWGATALLAAVPLLVRWRPRPGPGQGLAYVRDHLHQVPSLAADYGVVTVATQLLPFMVAAAAGLAATGGLRAALVLLGVVNVLVQGLMPVATVEAARLSAAGQPFVRRSVSWFSAAVAGVVVAYAGLILALPDQVGVALFAGSWSHAAPLLVPVALASALSGPMIAIQIALRGHGRLREALAVRAQTTVGLIGLPLVGALTWGEVGAAWGLATASAVGAVLAFRVAVRVEPPAAPSDRAAAHRVAVRVEPAATPSDRAADHRLPLPRVVGRGSLRQAERASHG